MKMKYSFILLIFLFAFACKKKDSCPEVTTVAPQTEIDNLRSYLQANSIQANEDSRGFFYIVTDSTFGSQPTVCDNITVAYKGMLLNGTVFDQSSNATFLLSNLILGWQEAIPLIGIGGSIKIYLPPSLAYGSKASGVIPANSNLVFDIDLIKF
ncbi:MAG: FKBP-type peptidylprolyl isomerase [Bacteroidetes bacterium OLB11]|nr:MAG: FKBP-type peptidylprolyl isomerase [Bacteroidetes bacterium OLB11]